MITKTQIGNVKVVSETEGLVEAFVNTMGVEDSDGDIIEPEAFNNALTGNLPIPFLLGHDQARPVGKVYSARPVHIEGEEWRLLASIQINMDKESGRDALSDIKGDFIREYSIGFNIPEGGSHLERSGDRTVRIITEADLVETSSVIRGASPNTATVSAKADPDIDPDTQSEEAADTENTASDADFVRARLSLLKARQELDGRKPKKKPRY
tara:strand:- start:9955 stop:10587 length:633 start_codon:yes stop_codon:yes gene_type:complete